MKQEGLTALLGALREQQRIISRSPLEARALLDEASRSAPWPAVKETHAPVAGVPCVHLEPEHAADGLLLYLHGGGFHVGSFATHGYFVRTLAAALRRRALFVEYRLAPEHPFPAALDDAAAVLAHAAAAHEDVIVAGDSAGGALALGAWQRLRPATVRGLLLVSPWLDLADWALAPGAGDYVLAAELRALADGYLRGAAADEARASPGRGSLDGLPRTFVSSGGAEVLALQVRRFVERARAAGAAVTHEEEPGLPHAFALFPAYSAARRALVEQVVRWAAPPP